MIDTKLARETKGGSVLQLCLYTDLVAKVQGVDPEFMYVVAPWSDFEPQVFRSSDYLAYYRLVRRSLEAAVADDADTQTYPDPQTALRNLPLAAGLRYTPPRRRSPVPRLPGTSGLQIEELRRRDITTVAALARRTAASDVEARARCGPGVRAYPRAGPSADRRPRSGDARLRAS